MIRHIAAIDQKRGLAKQDKYPWHLPTDGHYFNTQTKLFGGVVLMGRKTYEIIGHLPGRHNFVAAQDTNYQPVGVQVVHDIDQFLDEHEDVWIIGGGQIYAATLDRADELYLTEIDADYDCDTFYPEYQEKFEIAEKGEQQIENTTTFRFMVYKPKNPTKML